MKKTISKDRKHYIYNFFGIKFKKRRTAEFLLELIHKNARMPKDIYRIRDLFFYMPNYPKCIVQRYIYDEGDFYENWTLNRISKQIPENAIILDIGANIGNHSMYWVSQSNAKQVYAFEPVKYTFDILQKNVELNHFEDKIKTFNIGLSDRNGNAEISNWNETNLGGTSIKQAESGSIPIRKLDDVELDTDRIDFIKIDVEGHEIFMLNGAEKTIKKYKPIIFIETFDNLNEVKNILASYGYKLEEELENHNYIFKPVK